MTPSPAMATADDATAIQSDNVPRPVGETGDSPQRRAQHMHANALSFDLAREFDALRKEPSWLRGDRNAKTLVQEHDLRVVLVALKPAARLGDRESRTHVTVHVLVGRLLVHLAAGRTVEVFADRLVSIAPRVSHELEALEECAFLLTIAGTHAGPSVRALRASGPRDAAEGAHDFQNARAGQNWEDDGGRV